VIPNADAKNWLLLTSPEKRKFILSQWPRLPFLSGKANWVFEVMGGFQIHPCPYTVISAGAITFMFKTLASLEQPHELRAFIDSAARGYNPFISDLDKDHELA